jgi:hypothetical protein
MLETEERVRARANEAYATACALFQRARPRSRLFTKGETEILNRVP